MNYINHLGVTAGPLQFPFSGIGDKYSQGVVVDGAMLALTIKADETRKDIPALVLKKNVVPDTNPVTSYGAMLGYTGVPFDQKEYTSETAYDMEAAFTTVSWVRAFVNNAATHGPGINLEDLAPKSALDYIYKVLFGSQKIDNYDGKGTVYDIEDIKTQLAQHIVKIDINTEAIRKIKEEDLVSLQTNLNNQKATVQALDKRLTDQVNRLDADIATNYTKLDSKIDTVTDAIVKDFDDYKKQPFPDGVIFKAGSAKEAAEWKTR